jgi:AcrR family transcriptional regulator
VQNYIKCVFASDANLRSVPYDGRVTESLRERKRLRTRRALVDAAARLFDERGYAGTTVADIAAAAEVGTRTFFSYFASKEDLLFPESEDRIRASVELIRSARRGESPPDVLRRTVAAISGADDDLVGPMAPLRIRLAETEPAVTRVGAVFLLRAQQQMTHALIESYPDELDPVDAAAMVGTFVGAASGTLSALVSGSKKRSAAEVGERLRQAIDAALAGWSTARSAAAPPPAAQA